MRHAPETPSQVLRGLRACRMPPLARPSPVGGPQSQTSMLRRGRSVPSPGALEPGDGTRYQREPDAALRIAFARKSAPCPVFGLDQLETAQSSAGQSSRPRDRYTVSGRGVHAEPAAVTGRRLSHQHNRIGRTRPFHRPVPACGDGLTPCPPDSPRPPGLPPLWLLTAVADLADAGALDGPTRASPRAGGAVTHP